MGQGRILVMDDEAMILELTGNMLAIWVTMRTLPKRGSAP